MVIYIQGYHTFEKHENELEQVKVLHFPFHSTGLINVSKQDLIIQKWLDSDAPIEELHIESSTLLKVLPTQSGHATIKKLVLKHCSNLTDFNTVLERYPALEELIVHHCTIDFGKEINTIPNLKKLELHNSTINTLVGISNFPQLEKLMLVQCEIEELPEEISEMASLQELILQILPKIKKLPTLKNCSNIKYINLNQLESINSLDIDFSLLPTLEILRLSYLKNDETPLAFPTTVSHCKNLIQLSLIACDFPSLPSNLKELTKLSYLELRLLNIKELPDIFDNMTSLKRIVMNSVNIKTIPPSFGALTQLQFVELTYMKALEKFDCDFSRLQILETFDLTNLEKLVSLPLNLGSSPNLNRLSLAILPSLKEIPSEVFEDTNITRLRLTQLPITVIPDSILQNKNLAWLSINELPNLHYFPRGLGKLEHLTNISIGGLNRNKFQNINIHTRQDEFWNEDITARTHLFDWVFFKEKSTPIPFEIGSSILKTMGLSGMKKINNFLNVNLPFLNPDGKPINSTNIATGGKVFISGRLIGGKDEAKTKLEGLGLKVANKLTDDVPFVLLGKKPKYVEGLFNGKRIYFTQTELESLKKEINPGMLQAKETPADLVKNLNELVIAPDVHSTQVALELVQNHGLPTELEEAFLVLSHTLPKGKLKNDVRRFLRGKISDKKEKILESKTYPFAPHKVRDYLTNEEATRLYYVEYRKTGNLRPQFFQYNDGSHPHRREYFEKILPTMTRNPKRLNLEAAFNVEELNELFRLPHLQGKLKEVILFYPKSGERIDGLIEHKSNLRKLNLALHLVEKDFPTSIYELENLTGLRIGLSQLKTVPDGIGKLSKLKKLVIINRTGDGIELPNDIGELKKLTSIYLPYKMKLEKYEGKLPPVTGNVKI